MNYDEVVELMTNTYHEHYCKYGVPTRAMHAAIGTALAYGYKLTGGEAPSAEPKPAKVKRK